ncbi:MAG: hypothetical protein Q7N87_01245 [Candidatus Uhrbacteria bacterium]|nr:hypothetical protein [Candidatus Uhrbacteria bacterium]
MNQAWKTVVAVIVTAVVVGGGVYYWQQNKPPLSNSPVSSRPVSQDSVLYQDNENKFKFVTKQSCEKYLRVTKSGQGAEASYTVTLPLAKQWSGDFMYFGVMSQGKYDGISDEEFGGKPNIVMALNGGLLLTGGTPQDWPSESDLPAGCKVEAQKL